MKKLHATRKTKNLKSAFTLSDEDITEDIERVITTVIMPYVDSTHPFLQPDELRAECRFKLAQIISGNRLAACPTRAKAFSYIKTAFKNHVRSLVKKYAFTAKRGGVVAPRKNGRPRLDWNHKEAPKVCHVSINDPDAPVQIGVSDGNLARLSFLEEMGWRLSPLEQAVADHLMEQNDSDDEAAEEATAAFRAAHGLSRKGFDQARSQIRDHCGRILRG